MKATVSRSHECSTIPKPTNSKPGKLRKLNKTKPRKRCLKVHNPTHSLAFTARENGALRRRARLQRRWRRRQAKAQLVKHSLARSLRPTRSPRKHGRRRKEKRGSSRGSAPKCLALASSNLETKNLGKFDWHVFPPSWVSVRKKEQESL